MKIKIITVTLVPMGGPGTGPVGASPRILTSGTLNNFPPPVPAPAAQLVFLP